MQSSFYILVPFWIFEQKKVRSFYSFTDTIINYAIDFEIKYLYTKLKK